MHEDEMKRLASLPPTELRKEVKKLLLSQAPHGYTWDKKKLEYAVSNAMLKFREFKDGRMANSDSLQPEVKEMGSVEE